MHSVFSLGEEWGFLFETSELKVQQLKSFQFGRFAAFWTKISSFEMVVGNIHQSGCSIVTAQCVKICSSNVFSKDYFLHFCTSSKIHWSTNKIKLCYAFELYKEFTVRYVILLIIDMILYMHNALDNNGNLIWMISLCSNPFQSPVMMSAFRDIYRWWCVFTSS